MKLATYVLLYTIAPSARADVQRRILRTGANVQVENEAGEEVRESFVDKILAKKHKYLESVGDDGPEHIIGGEPLPRGLRPYLISLGVEFPDDFGGYFHVCGATLITSRVVLTAAHCVTNFDGNFELATSYPWTINLNKYELDDDTDVLSYPLCPYEHGHDCGPDQAYGVVHPYYDSIIDHDFALLFLPDDVPDIQPVQLNADPNLPVDGDVLDTFGWGETEFGSPNVPYTVDLHYVPNEQCIAYPYRWPADLITPSMLCAIDEGKDTCYGDSGGPAVLDSQNGTSVQVGVTSFGGFGGCADPLYPSGFSRVSSAIEWINKTVCGEVGEWCGDDDDDGDYCFKMKDDNIHHTTSDSDVDLLPGFLEEMIESGVLVQNTAIKNERPEKKKKHRLLSVNHINSGNGVKPQGIIGGDEVEENEMPYLVAIGAKGLNHVTPSGYVCSGTLIAHNVVLSAAHCFTDRYGNKVKLDWLDLKRNDLSSDEGVIRLFLKKSSIWRHQHYNYITHENDIALIFLQISVDIEPVKLNSHPDIPAAHDDSLVVSGWGLTNPDGYYPYSPRSATVDYLPNAECMHQEFDITADMMCTRGANGPCSADSGGPIVVHTDEGHFQVGVTSVDTCQPKPEKRPPCANDMKLLTVEIVTDEYPEETSWTLTNLCTGAIEAKVDQYREPETLHIDQYCVYDNEYEFTIFDSYGDGLCCSAGEGSYTVTLYDEGVAEEVASGGVFEAVETTTFGNPNSSCEQEPAIYSRVSSGMDWIERALECNSISRSSKSGKSSKAGKARKRHALQ